MIEWSNAHSNYDCVAQSSTVASRKVADVILKDAQYTWTYLTSITMNRNTNKQLYTDVYPYDATNMNLIWSTTNTSVITVTSDGLLTAISPGTAYLTIDSQDGECIKKIKVTVN